LQSKSSRQSSYELRLSACFAATLIGASVGGAALGYVGPGAGFALVSGFLVIFTTIVLAGLSLLVWPFRMLWRFLRRRNRSKPLIRRFIVVGLDGQDPRITDRLLSEGRLPNFQRLAEKGCYERLQTVYPSLSPVAWSSFGTGTNPGGHNVFDFVERDPRNYMPRQASVEIGQLEKTLKIGKFKIPLHKPTLRLLRKSKPFWTILGEHNIWSTVLRVPITFPPDKFYGAQLSAMMVPDLLGTLGTFLYYTTRRDEAGTKDGGQAFVLERQGSTLTGVLQGPENSFLEGDPPMELPLHLELGDDGGALLKIGKESVSLEPRKLSDWVTITFAPAPAIKVDGLTRVMLLENGEHVSLYFSPINLDSEKPAMPISHPSYYSTYLSKKIGKYATLGLAEDTEALKEGITDDATFLQQAYDIDDERQEMFFSALDRLRKGSLVCVFDGTDRIQHMFWRYYEKGHPADPTNGKAEHRDTIDELYVRNDALVGKVLDQIDDDDVLCVISDHGFTSFRRGVNLNGWLLDNGYLHLKEGADGSGDWLKDVDWSRTRAYFLGLAGMFINLKGREAQGIVEPGEEAQALKRELSDKLAGLRDDEKDEIGIIEIFDTAEIYSGPYTANAPDFIIGYNEGYRTSWDCANGIVAGPLFEDNVKAWSGDHGIDPRLVPGIFFCNHAVDAEDPSILDLAPTVLGLFGLEPPRHMEGRSLFDLARFGKAA
jgi:predicted AlkP superfamily phosphohydrolase/phosphomutase